MENLKNTLSELKNIITTRISKEIQPYFDIKLLEKILEKSDKIESFFEIEKDINDLIFSFSVKKEGLNDSLQLTRNLKDCLIKLGESIETLSNSKKIIQNHLLCLKKSVYY